MLPRKYRLPSRMQFTRAHVGYFRLFVVKSQNNTLECNRFGFVVSKRVDKRAVERNRIKRVLRSLVGKEFLKGGKDILFIVKPAITKASTQEVEKEIANILRK